MFFQLESKGQSKPMKLLLITCILNCMLMLGSLAEAQQYAAVDTRNQPLSNKICATCHGAYGQGNPVVGAPSLAGLEPWYIRNQLEKFRSHLRGVEGDYIPAFEMQASVAALSDTEITEVIAYIETWPQLTPAPTIIGNSTNGAKLFSGCAACHGSTGMGNQALAAPGLAGRDDWYLYRQIKLFQSGYRGGHPEDLSGQQMRAAVRELKSEQDILDVLSYINTFTPST